MAWVVVLGSNGIWEYDDAATASDTYPDANGTTTNGVRAFIPPNSGNPQYTYVKVRKAGATTERGELSKNYYDARISGPGAVINNIILENGANLFLEDGSYLLLDP